MSIKNPEIPDFTGNRISITTEDEVLEFDAAKDMAKQKARELSADPMLLSWYRGKTGEYYPAFECGSSQKPAWIVFAEARGGDILVNINDGEYVFIYLSVD
ncbi:hypothetical protein DENIS_1793 [Desulfonema ishimotonii]|uniref:DUF5619 domain-containing protein n=1 Tax=Desulfonema ishimotonii TaxID=45657 RepID=A0A401FV62_9BACT|nr:AF1514 family protein [Desulfonema ishimotonii]GBC60834.1 hypothetical protein DENIS_1793 [Desulfonema ishimotonii]